jgi:hypothetical protein
MIEFEQEFPEIAAKYYDLRFEDIKPKRKKQYRYGQLLSRIEH